MDTSQFVLVPLSLKLSILSFFNFLFYSVFNSIHKGGASHGNLRLIRTFPFGCSFFFSLSFNFLFSICYALLSFKYLSEMPNKVVKKKLVVSVTLFNLSLS